MKRKIISIILLFSMIISIFSVIPAKNAKAEGTTIKIHYHRFDSDYDGWNIWAWPEAKDGAAYDFNEVDDFGALGEFTVENLEQVDNLGFIIRLNEWEEKDVDADRFISLDNIKDQVLEFYLVQGDPQVYTKIEDIDLSPKFLNASLDDFDRINIEVSAPFTVKDSKDSFIVEDEYGEKVDVKAVMPEVSFVESVNKASIILEESLAIDKKYTVAKEGYGKMSVTTGNIFSSKEFNTEYFYQGDDLGAVYSEERTSFRLWAPTADDVVVNLYEKGDGDNLIKTIPMNKDINGTWLLLVEEDLEGVYFTYSVDVEGQVNEAVDPYAKAIGVNGNRGMVIDLATTNPDGWDKDGKPEFKNMNDAVIYELHVRDLSMSDTSGIKNKGKYLGLTETGTKNNDGLSTGLDHIKELGITHLHLLPVFDHRSIDETKLESNSFNWGYDPQNYNAVEGSYSTDPYNGHIRIKEFKEMVSTLHKNDIRVVMDVVYNHTGATNDSDFNKIVPKYYYRMDGNNFSNGSACGNETASEREMVRKFIVDSVVYWATEYHIDGFRFDLMGLHDIETMNAVREALDKIDPSIIIYGEGWTGGATPYPEAKLALKKNTYMMPNIAAFSDDIRDAIKGHVFNSEEKGFVSGASGLEESVKFGIVGGIYHPQVNYPFVKYSKEPWANSPSQSINYVSAHDNLTLWDKFEASNPDDSRESKIKMNKMSSAIVLTSQGIPFIHAGEEFLRTKGGDENSYKSPDSVNMIDWDLKTENKDVFDYYQGLIEFRKLHPALRIGEAEEIVEKLKFLEINKELPSDNMVGYIISDNANGDTASNILVIHNGNNEAQDVVIPEGTWNVYINGDTAGTEIIETISGGMVNVSGISTMVLTNDDNVIKDEKPITDESISNDNKDAKQLILITISLILIVIIIAGIVIKIRKDKK